MDCSTLMRKYSRFLLVFFNFLFVITGIIILSVGAAVKAYYHEYGALLENKYFYASDFLIAIGVVIFAIAFFGCCGAVKENACMTMTFSSLLIVIFILELLAGIAGVLLKNKADDMIDKALTDTLKQYDNPANNETTAMWDRLQENFNCCGVHNYTDWTNKNGSTKGLIPISCCKYAHGATGSFSCNADSPGLHQEGCLEVFGDYIEGHAISIESVGLGLAIIQLLGIVLSCYLAKQIKSDYETV